MSTITVLIPAHNSAAFVADTVRSALNQSRPADRVLVAADRCTDDTVAICRSLGADVIEVSGGSKAKAQNAALPYITTALVLPLDDDSVLDEDYLAHIVPIFEADRTHEVSVAAGKVLTRYARTWTERARQLEYLSNFHSLRPLQQATGSVTVAAGCCSVFRVHYLREAGGFPERTLVEDIDYSLTQHRMRRRVEYCSRAICRAAEPDTTALMRTQLRRWKHGWGQAVKANLPGLLVRKQRVAGWLLSQLWELAISPVIMLAPLYLALTGGWAALAGLLPYVAATELVLFWVPVLIGCRVTGYPVREAIRSYPCWLALKALNFEADVKAGLVNFVLVPLRLRRPYLTYQCGHATS